MIINEIISEDIKDMPRVQYCNIISIKFKTPFHEKIFITL
jgi:hypothetical protein